MNRVLSVVSLSFFLLLGGCNSTQAPAPVVYYGHTEGEGSAGVHNVISGDTLYSISNRYKISMRDIVYVNKLTAPFNLAVGQRLKLPPPREYRVRSGDNLYAISRIFEVSPSELANLNNIYAPYTVQAGQVLTLPSATPNVVTEQVAARDYSAPAGKAVPAASVSSSDLPAPTTKPTTTRTASTKTPVRKPKITAKTPARSSSKFMTPVRGNVISNYGPKSGGLHNDGINIAAPKGTPVAAAEHGVVVYVGDELKGSGNLVLIRHSDRWMSAYAHLDKTTVKRGQTINRGSKIGTVGDSGSVTTPQLHFELRRGTQAINPKLYL